MTNKPTPKEQLEFLRYYFAAFEESSVAHIHAKFMAKEKGLTVRQVHQRVNAAWSDLEKAVKAHDALVEACVVGLQRVRYDLDLRDGAFYTNRDNLEVQLVAALKLARGEKS